MDASTSSLAKPAPPSPRPVVLSYVPVYCRPEMLHVHRQVTGLQRWQAHVLTQKRENAETFPLPSGAISIVPKYPWRFFRRLWFTQLRRIPWQVARPELTTFLQALSRHHAQLAHIYFGHMAMHWLPLLRTSPVPVVVSFHGADSGVEMGGAIQRAQMREVFSLATRILARSQALLEDLAALGCPREKLVLNRTGIPLEEFPYRPRSAPADGRWILLQGGRLIEKKGHRTTLKAFATIRQQFPMARLRFAGEGPGEESLRQFAAELGLHDAVDWLGFLKPDAMRAELEQAHLFLHPSETARDGNREGVPNAMLEAMATGLPVVATRHGGIPEAIDSGHTGWLVEEQDTAGLAECCLHGMQNPDHLWQIGKMGSASVAAGFSRPAALANLESIYDAACAESDRHLERMALV